MGSIQTRWSYSRRIGGIADQSVDALADTSKVALIDGVAEHRVGIIFNHRVGTMAQRFQIIALGSE